jgi:hypothetical protein
MKLKLKHKALAGAISAAFAAPAFALDTGVDNPATDTVNIFSSGATAQDQGIENLFAALFCSQTGAGNAAVSSLDVYVINNTTRIYYCSVTPSLASSLGVANTFKIAFRKFVSGGSGNGVTPLVSGTNLAFAAFSSGTAANCPVTTTRPYNAITGGGPIAAIPEYRIRTCSGQPTVSVRPDIGLSDVEPSLFTSADTSGWTVASANVIVFAIPVTKVARDALQSAQGLSVGADDEANQPSLTRAQVAGIFQGQISRWNQFSGVSGTPVTATGSLSVGLGQNALLVSRRVSTSGTQVYAQIYFLGRGCVAGSPTFVSGPSVAASTSNVATYTGNRIQVLSGSGDVQSSLNFHNTFNRFAIGVLTTELPPSTSSGYRFVKINGAYPSLLNTINGSYDYYSQQTLQYNPVLTSDTATIAMFGQLSSALANVSIIKVLNDGFNATAISTVNPGGVLALNSSTAVPAPPYSAAQVYNQPVATFSKALLGTPNNCLPGVNNAPNASGGAANSGL